MESPPINPPTDFSYVQELQPVVRRLRPLSYVAAAELVRNGEPIIHAANKRWKIGLIGHVMRYDVAIRLIRDFNLGVYSHTGNDEVWYVSAKRRRLLMLEKLRDSYQREMDNASAKLREICRAIEIEMSISGDR